jgi:hypothetical protein
MLMHSRTLFIMVLVMLRLITPLESANSPRSLKGLVVVDSTGKNIGPVLGIDDTLRYAVVAFTVNGFTFALSVDSMAFTGSDRTLLFESTDCTGTPYLFSNVVTLLPVVVVSVPGSTVYRADDTTEPIFINSRTGADTPPGVCESLPQTQESIGSIAIPVVDLSTLFTPPFHVRPEK